MYVVHFEGWHQVLVLKEGTVSGSVNLKMSPKMHCWEALTTKVTVIRLKHLCVTLVWNVDGHQVVPP